MSDFDRFRDEVISDYQHRKREKLLPIELERPSPTQLMNYCLTLLHRNELADDLSTLTWIFNAERRYSDLETAIRKFGPDGFKSLQNFMLGRTRNPSERIVKLLAILTDFRPRPYNRWIEERFGYKEAAVGTKMDIDPERAAEKGDGGVPYESGNRKPGVWLKLKRSVLYGSVAFAGVIGANQLSENFDRECMYWQVDHYEPVACHEKSVSAELIPLDREVVNKFRKIMRPDTLTLRSVGKVWYGKPTVDSIEFFTAGGRYPRDSRKALKPATAYIIKKYVLDRKVN